MNVKDYILIYADGKFVITRDSDGSPELITIPTVVGYPNKLEDYLRNVIDSNLYLHPAPIGTVVKDNTVYRIFLAVCTVNVLGKPAGINVLDRVNYADVVNIPIIGELCRTAPYILQTELLLKVSEVSTLGYRNVCCLPEVGYCETAVVLPNSKIITVDKCLVAEILSLHKNGFITIASCCGHNKSSGTITLEKPMNEEEMELLGYRLVSPRVLIPKTELKKYEGDI